jgi:hypothetical protein
MSRVPVIRELSWPAVIPQMIALGCAVAIGWFFVPTPNGIALGAAAYLAYSFGSRRYFSATIAAACAWFAITILKQQFQPSKRATNSSGDMRGRIDSGRLL